MTVFSTLLFLLTIFTNNALAAENDHEKYGTNQVEYRYHNKSLEYLCNCIYYNNDIQSLIEPINIIEYIYDNDITLMDSEIKMIDTIIENTADSLWGKQYVNIDDLSHYLLIDELQGGKEQVFLRIFQNPDGGFGLAKNYASDIIDTKLALKALADLGETEAILECYYRR